MIHLELHRWDETNCFIILIFRLSKNSNISITIALKSEFNGKCPQLSYKIAPSSQITTRSVSKFPLGDFNLI